MELFCSLNMWRSYCIISLEKWKKKFPSTWQFISPPSRYLNRRYLNRTCWIPPQRCSFLSTADQRSLGDLGNTWLPRSKLISVNLSLLAISFISWPLLSPTCLPLILEATLSQVCLLSLRSMIVLVSSGKEVPFQRQHHTIKYFLHWKFLKFEIQLHTPLSAGRLGGMKVCGKQEILSTEKTPLFHSEWWKI